MNKRIWWSVGAVLLAAVLVYALAGVGCDYPGFKLRTQTWLAGETRLFDAGAPGFFYAPWSLAVFVPLSFLPDRIASTLMNTASLACILLSIQLLVGRAPWWVVVVAVSNIYTANLLGANQWDAYILAAIAVGWWAIQNEKPVLLGLALAVVGTKPTNALLPALLLLSEVVVRRWSWRRWVAVLIIPVECLLASFLISGLDWPWRYVHFVRLAGPNAGYNVTFWRSTTALEGLLELATIVASVTTLGWVINRRGIDGVTLSLALLVNLIFSPYATIYHYVIVIPLIVWLGLQDSLWLVWVYAASAAWVLIREPFLPLFPAALALAVLVVQVQRQRRTVLEATV